ncbi:MAG: 23S rRNA (pseudouridine(1915)-N(3))-methyltransferase RlmH [Acidobacteriota bacterium]
MRRIRNAHNRRVFPLSREIHILWAARHKRPAWEGLCSDYRQRIARSVPVRDLPVKVRRDGPRRKAEEGQALLAALPDPVWLFALDEGGKSSSSRRFATTLQRLFDEWPHPIAFVIGSDLGLDPTVRRQARQVLSFGPMTLRHELARLVLYEQVYRALEILRGSGYHH